MSSTDLYCLQTILTDSPPDPNAKADAPPVTYIHVLEQQTEASLRPLANGKIDESESIRGDVSGKH